MGENNYETLRREVDSLRSELSGQRGSWLSKPSNLISLLAFLFSFGTTIASFYNAHLQDIHNNRIEVRSLIQRMAKLPIENYELMQKYRGSGTGQALSGMINQENILLATQAAELIEKYPDTFSSTEYFAVAWSLAQSNIVSKVPFLFQKAIDKATNSNDYNVAARAYGAFLYAKGDYSEGKKYYQLALNVWDKFPERSRYIINSYDLVTFMYWAQSEMGANNFAEARKRLNMAKEKLAQLPSGPNTDAFADQINATQSAVENK